MFNSTRTTFAPFIGYVLAASLLWMHCSTFTFSSSSPSPSPARPALHRKASSPLMFVYDRAPLVPSLRQRHRSRSILKLQSSTSDPQPPLAILGFDQDNFIQNRHAVPHPAGRHSWSIVHRYHLVCSVRNFFLTRHSCSPRCSVYGITCLQGFLYFTKHCQRDGQHLKGLVRHIFAFKRDLMVIVRIEGHCSLVRTRYNLADFERMLNSYTGCWTRCTSPCSRFIFTIILSQTLVIIRRYLVHHGESRCCYLRCAMIQNASVGAFWSDIISLLVMSPLMFFCRSRLLSV